MMDIARHAIIWTIIPIIAFGIGLFFRRYAASQFVTSRMVIYDNTNKNREIEM